MVKRSFLVPTWAHVLLKHGRLGLLSLLYLRRRLEEDGLYPQIIGDSTIVQLIAQRQAAWYKRMRWKGGSDDKIMRNPEGVKTWLNRDLSDFRRICAGEKDERLSHSHARAAMVITKRITTASGSV